MNKWKIGLGIVAVSCGLSFGLGTTTNANAASWHHGMPKFFRGTWSNKYNLWLNHKNEMTIYEGHSKTAGYYMPYTYNHLRYKRVHYTYKIRAWDKFGRAWSTFKWRIVNHNTFVLGNGIKVYRYHK